MGCGRLYAVIRKKRLLAILAIYGVNLPNYLSKFLVCVSERAK